MGRFIAPEDGNTVAQRFRERIAGNDPPSTDEIEVLSADGDRISVEITVGQFEHDGQSATVSIVRDVTESANGGARFDITGVEFAD